MSSKRGRKCSIKTCDNFQHTHKHLSFFRYPKDAVRCRQWIDKTKRFDLLDKINVHDERICQQHFEPTMFLNESQNRLQQYAIPTLHLTTKPPPSQTPIIDLSNTEHMFHSPQFNMDMVDAAAALLYQNNLTITPVYSSKPKPTLSEPINEPLNLSSSSQNGSIAHHNSIVLNTSDSSNGSLNCSMQPISATTMTTVPSTNGQIKVPTITTNAGGSRRPRQVFLMEQENELADYVRETSNYYSGLSSKEVRILAFVYGVCNQVEMPVGWRESHQASFDWCVGFIKRTKLPPTMVTSISTKGSGKQSKSTNSNSNANSHSNANFNTNFNANFNANSSEHKANKTPQQVNGDSTKNIVKIDNVIPIEID